MFVEVSRANITTPSAFPALADKEELLHEQTMYAEAKGDQKDGREERAMDNATDRRAQKEGTESKLRQINIKKKEFPQYVPFLFHSS